MYLQFRSTSQGEQSRPNVARKAAHIKSPFYVGAKCILSAIKQFFRHWNKGNKTCNNRLSDEGSNSPGRSE